MSRLDPYPCQEAVRRLADYLDRALSPEEMARVQAHLELCAECARAFGYEASVLREIRSKLARINLPPDLLVRISARLRESEA